MTLSPELLRQAAFVAISAATLLSCMRKEASNESDPNFTLGTIPVGPLWDQGDRSHSAHIQSMKITDHGTIAVEMSAEDTREARFCRIIVRPEQCRLNDGFELPAQQESSILEIELPLPTACPWPRQHEALQQTLWRLLRLRAIFLDCKPLAESRTSKPK